MRCYALCLLFLPAIVCFSGCSPKYSRYISQYRIQTTDTIPDYSNLYYWAAHPWKKDPSDSVPGPLLSGYRPDSSADVFFVYPTTFTDATDPRWNATITDAAINAKTDYSPILYQASAFNVCRVFSPRYRQANLKSYYTTDSARAEAAFDLAYADVKTAFQYYLDHFNGGRPIIIASHSQGSTHAQRLLQDFFDKKPLREKLVVAYIAGMYIPPDRFTSLPACSDSLQTGCICGWRTFKKNYEPAFVQEEKINSLVTNPLTGTNRNGYAEKNANKGALLRRFNIIRRHLVGAEIHDGVIWIGKLHLPGAFLIRRKNFHVGDINLFYVNIREDLSARLAAYRTQRH